MQKVLLVIDMQNDFISGVLGTKEAQEIVPAVKELVENYAGPVVFTQDTHDEDEYPDTPEAKIVPVTHCAEGTWGWEIVDGMEAGACGVIKKDRFGVPDWPASFFRLGLEPQKIEIVGVCTDICVVTNALLLRTAYPELQITVRENCCAGSTPKMHKRAIKVMQSCGITII